MWFHGCSPVCCVKNFSRGNGAQKIPKTRCAFAPLRESSSLHSSFRCDRDAKELLVSSRPAGVTDAVDHTIFRFAGVRTLLSWPLVWTNADLLILFGAGVPQVELVRDVAAHRIAFVIEQHDAVCTRRVEPVV